MGSWLHLDDTTTVVFIRTGGSSIASTHNMLSTAAMELTESPCIFQFLIPCFTLNPRICPLNSLTEFLNRTCSLGNNEKRLFISYVKPHNVVSRDTISRATKFSTRSTRVASASKVKGKDVPLDILSTAGWLSAETFWYDTLFIVVHTLNYMD